MKTKSKAQEWRNTGKTDKNDDKNWRFREGNKEAMRQTQRERYKRDKDKIDAKKEKGENRRKKNSY